MPFNPDLWLELYGDYLFSIAMLKVNNREQAEDLVQETFLAAFRAKDAFQGKSTEKTWLVAILNNKITDYYRKKDVLKEADQYLQETDQDFYKHFFDSEGGIADHWSRGAVPQAWPDVPIEAKEFYQILQYCLSKLPTRLQPVFLARFLDEQTAAEICKEFQITSSNYWVMIHRAKILMRSCLETNWYLKGNS